MKPVTVKTKILKYGLCEEQPLMSRRIPEESHGKNMHNFTLTVNWYQDWTRDPGALSRQGSTAPLCKGNIIPSVHVLVPRLDDLTPPSKSNLWSGTMLRFPGPGHSVAVPNYHANRAVFQTELQLKAPKNGEAIWVRWDSEVSSENFLYSSRNLQQKKKGIQSEICPTPWSLICLFNPLDYFRVVFVNTYHLLYLPLVY